MGWGGFPVRQIAEKTIKQKTGARGLRAIIENAMMDVMFRVPSMENVKTVTIDRAFIEGEGDAKIEFSEVGGNENEQ